MSTEENHETIISPEVKEYFRSLRLYPYTLVLTTFFALISYVVTGKLDIPAAIWVGVFIHGVICLFAISRAYIKVRGFLMRQFAQKENFSYIKRGDINSVGGFFFEKETKSKISDVASGSRNELPMRVFLLYSTDSGVGSTVFECTFPHPVPQINLQGLKPFYSSKNNKGTALVGIEFMRFVTKFNNSKQLTFEGDFNSNFSVWVKKEFEQEAFEIFTPEFMELLLETSASFGLKFFGNKVYLIVPKFFDRKWELDSWFLIFCRICDYLNPKVNEVAGYVKAMEEVVSRKND